MKPALSYRVLLFDLFGTVILFKPEVPETNVAGRPRRSTMEWMHESLRRELPQVSVEDFLRAMGAVTEEIVRSRPPEHYEVQSSERFRRALESLGQGGDDMSEMAERLCLAHMAYLAERTQMPAAHATLLRDLSGAGKIGLVSNFDHAPTVHSILQREGINDVFGTTIISAEVGRRKPHPSLFLTALERLEGRPDEALFIGDSLHDDVVGAHAAGIDVAWINPKGRELPADVPVPRFQIQSLAELRAVLGLH